jgi:hypothetical protein
MRSVFQIIPLSVTLRSRALGLNRFQPLRRRDRQAVAGAEHGGVLLHGHLHLEPQGRRGGAEPLALRNRSKRARWPSLISGFSSGWVAPGFSASAVAQSG